MDNQLIHLIIFLIVVKLLIVNCNPIEEIKSTEWKSSEKLDDIDDRQPTTINKSAINEDSTAKLKPRQYWLPGVSAHYGPGPGLGYGYGLGYGLGYGYPPSPFGFDYY